MDIDQYRRERLLAASIHAGRDHSTFSSEEIARDAFESGWDESAIKVMNYMMQLCGSGQPVGMIRGRIQLLCHQVQKNKELKCREKN